VRSIERKLTRRRKILLRNSSSLVKKKIGSKGGKDGGTEIRKVAERRVKGMVSERYSRTTWIKTEFLQNKMCPSSERWYGRRERAKKNRPTRGHR